MDVVRRNIEKSGRIDIQSKEEKAHQSQLPSAYTCNYRWNGRTSWHERYIIPTLSIEESFRPKKKR